MLDAALRNGEQIPLELTVGRLQKLVFQRRHTFPDIHKPDTQHLHACRFKMYEYSHGFRVYIFAFKDEKWKRRVRVHLGQRCSRLLC